MKRSHDALRARDRGRQPPFVPDRTPFDDLELRAWLRAHHATLEAPTTDRPYWTVRRHGQYVAAGPSPARAIRNAQKVL
jgi:hypothetical protein